MTGDDVLRMERPFDGCALVTLDRPRASNALDMALRRRLVEEIRRLDADTSVRVIVLTGAGNTFCAGLDLKELGSAQDTAAILASGAEADPIGALRQVRAPVIGAINGAAITGGFELALACDVLLASSQARFADTHARVGVIPGWGLSQRLPRLVGPYRAKELSLSGRFIEADEAYAWGLVNRVVAPEQLLPAAFELARAMLAMQPQLVVAYKQLIDEGYGLELKSALALETERSRAHARGDGSG